jgi:preprotein translocase subunit SecD
MTTLVRTLLSAAVLALSGVGADEKPAVKIEFRLAEREPAEGLVEAMVAGTKDKIYLHKGPGVTNEDIAEARLDPDGSPKVLLTFTKTGKEKMTKFTEAHQGKPLAILVDGKVIAAPTVRSAIAGNAVISVRTKEEAERIAKGLQIR